MDLMHRIFYTAVGAISIFYFIVKASLSHWKKRGILHEKPNFLWGNLKGVGSKRHISAVLDEIYSNYKGKAPFIGFYAWLRPLVFVLDIELVRRILIEDAINFQERGLYNNIQYDPLSENLIQLDHEEYKNLYRQISPCFAKRRLQSMLPTLLKACKTFNQSLDIQQRITSIFNINELVAAYNTDVISYVAFGRESDTLSYSNTEFHCMSKDFYRKISFIKMYLAWSFPNLARFFCLKMYNEQVTDYYSNLVQRQLVLRTGGNAVKQPHPNFLDYFADINLSNTDNRTNEQIAAQCFTWLSVGLGASNTTLTMCLYELALHCDIQDKARSEIENVMKQHQDKLTVESLNDMVYLKQILYETLRKYSPYPFLLRNTLKDYEIPDSIFMLQEGNGIIIPVTSIHHDSSIYPNPQKFDPSRFDPLSVQHRNPAAFLPFGAGPRSCMLKEFSEMQMLVCLVTLLRQYEIKSCVQTPIQIQYDASKLILTPKTVVELRLERISNCCENMFN